MDHGVLQLEVDLCVKLVKSEKIALQDPISHFFRGDYDASTLKVVSESFEVLKNCASACFP